MVLSDREIEMELRNGNLVINPEVRDAQIGPSSIDLHLSNRFTIFKTEEELAELGGLSQSVDLANITNVEAIVRAVGKENTLADGETLKIMPREFILAYTREYIEIPNYLAARVEGRSTLARLGLSIHQTAPTVHATFKGQLRLEIVNNGPVPCELSPGIAICQLILERLGWPAVRSLTSAFQNQSQGYG